jgi:hypothetical protein
LQKTPAESIKSLHFSFFDLLVAHNCACSAIDFRFALYEPGTMGNNLFFAKQLIATGSSSCFTFVQILLYAFSFSRICAMAG